MKTLLLAIGFLLPCLAVRGDDHHHRTPDKERYGFFIANNRTSTRIPFQLHSNLIIVPVQINQSDTLYFILDTGVSNTIITDPDAFREKPLTLTRKIKLSGAGGGGQSDCFYSHKQQSEYGRSQGCAPQCRYPG